MHESNPEHSSASGVWRENEEQAWRLWLASARRAAVSVKHKRHIAAEIYWRSAFDIALANLERVDGGRFAPVHVLEPLQGLVNLWLEQGRWMAARSLFNEVADILNRKGFTLSGLAERVLNAIGQRVAQAQKDVDEPTELDNVEDLPVPVAHRGLARRSPHAGPRLALVTSGSVG